MPAQGHSSAPRLTPDIPRELQYLQELEMLFIPVQVINNAEKKKHAVIFHKCLTPKSVTIMSYMQQK
jgi:hypothetical protein